MKKSEIEIGKCYRAKISGKLTTVRVDEIEKTIKSIYKQQRTIYICTNLTTGREVIIKSAQKFRSEVN